MNPKETELFAERPHNIGGSGISGEDFQTLSFSNVMDTRAKSFHLSVPFNLLFIDHEILEDKGRDLIFQISPAECSTFRNEVPLKFFNKLELHRHDFIELMFVLEGEVYQNIENKRHFYPEGSCCILGCNTYHQEEIKGSGKLVFLQLTLSYLQELLSSPVYFENKLVNFLTPHEQDIFDFVTDYLKKHNGRFRRKDLEEELHYSSDYIYKIVRKYTGLSLSDYGMRFCMEKAGELLRETTLSIGEIMATLQFSNQTRFYACFRDYYGMSPAKYRKNQ